MKKFADVALVLAIFSLSATCFALNRVDISGEYTCSFADGRVGTMQISQGRAFSVPSGTPDQIFVGTFYINSPKWGPYKFGFPSWVTNRNPYEWGLGNKLFAVFEDTPVVWGMELTIVSSNSLSGTWMDASQKILTTFSARKNR